MVSCAEKKHAGCSSLNVSVLQRLMLQSVGRRSASHCGITQWAKLSG